MGAASVKANVLEDARTRVPTVHKHARNLTSGERGGVPVRSRSSTSGSPSPFVRSEFALRAHGTEENAPIVRSETCPPTERVSARRLAACFTRETRGPHVLRVVQLSHPRCHGLTLVRPLLIVAARTGGSEGGVRLGPDRGTRSFLLGPRPPGGVPRFDRLLVPCPNRNTIRGYPGPSFAVITDLRGGTCLIVVPPMRGDPPGLF
jgi:hypothetical protein